MPCFAPRPALVLASSVTVLSGLAGIVGTPAAAQQTAPPPLLPEPVVRALASEVSGTAAKRTVQDLTLLHRQRGSRPFNAAAERIRDAAQVAGLTGVEILSFPADGTIFYGTQRSRPAWDADFAELWEQRSEPAEKAAKATGTAWVDARRVASWEASPISLAEDSASGEVAADLVDVGEGTNERDYLGRDGQGKDVKGKLVLASGPAGPVSMLAIDRFGAAGIVSCAQNQQTAWYRQDENLVRWGHLNTFPPPTTFAFMVSLREARAWRERLAAGERVHLRASVRAGQHPGAYEVVTGTLPGADPALAGQEIVLSCHLDHQRPGANDNASGCASILEVARTLAKLIREQRIAPPRRTIRFVWPPEIEGTITLLNARPDLAARARAVIHMDMVGGNAETTKAVFHVTRSPKSLPTFVDDVGEAFGRFLNEQSWTYAATGWAPYPLADPEGDRRALQAEPVDFTEGSDHEVWEEGSWRVPAIYLNDWPDRTIHTNADSVANIDPTKLLRAAFLGAASAYYLAGVDAASTPALWEVMRAHMLARMATALERAAWLRGSGLPDAAAEAANRLRFEIDYDRGVADSIGRFATLPAATRQEADRFLQDLGQIAGVPATAGAAPADAADRLVYQRSPEPKGPLTGFGYSYLEDRRTALELPAPALASHAGLWGGAGEIQYEALNLIDGHRTVRQVRDDLAAIYGPVPLETVASFLELLAKIGVLSPSPAP